MEVLRSWYPDLHELIDGAEMHGKQSDPDHEPGDLRAILQTCWSHMTPEQRARVRAEHDEIAEWARSADRDADSPPIGLIP